MAPPAIARVRSPRALSHARENTSSPSREGPDKSQRGTLITSSITSATTRPPLSRPVSVQSSRPTSSTSNPQLDAIAKIDLPLASKVGGARRALNHPAYSKGLLRVQSGNDGAVVVQASKPHLPGRVAITSAKSLNYAQCGPIRPSTEKVGESSNGRTAATKSGVIDHKRVVGGARRVPKPVVPQEEPLVDAKKPAVQNPEVGRNQREERSRSPSKSEKQETVIEAPARMENEDETKSSANFKTTLTSRPKPPTRSKTDSTLQKPAQLPQANTLSMLAASSTAPSSLTAKVEHTGCVSRRNVGGVRKDVITRCHWR